MNPMTPDEFKESMKWVFNQSIDDDDPEKWHDRGDAMLCEMLVQLGYGKGVGFFRKLHKWYP